MNNFSRISHVFSVVHLFLVLVFLGTAHGMEEREDGSKVTYVLGEKGFQQYIEQARVMLGKLKVPYKASGHEKKNLLSTLTIAQIQNDLERIQNMVASFAHELSDQYIFETTAAVFKSFKMNKQDVESPIKIFDLFYNVLLSRSQGKTEEQLLEIMEKSFFEKEIEITGSQEEKNVKEKYVTEVLQKLLPEEQLKELEAGKSFTHLFIACFPFLLLEQLISTKSIYAKPFWQWILKRYVSERTIKKTELRTFFESMLLRAAGREDTEAVAIIRQIGIEGSILDRHTPLVRPWREMPIVKRRKLKGFRKGLSSAKNIDFDRMVSILRYKDGSPQTIDMVKAWLEQIKEGESTAAMSTNVREELSVLLGIACDYKFLEIVRSILQDFGQAITDEQLYSIALNAFCHHIGSHRKRKMGDSVRITVQIFAIVYDVIVSRSKAKTEEELEEIKKIFSIRGERVGSEEGQAQVDIYVAESLQKLLTKEQSAAMDVDNSPGRLFIACLPLLLLEDLTGQYTSDEFAAPLLAWVVYHYALEERDVEGSPRDIEYKRFLNKLFLGAVQGCHLSFVNALLRLAIKQNISLDIKNEYEKIKEIVTKEGENTSVGHEQLKQVLENFVRENEKVSKINLAGTYLNNLPREILSRISSMMAYGSLRATTRSFRSILKMLHSSQSQSVLTEVRKRLRDIREEKSIFSAGERQDLYQVLYFAQSRQLFDVATYILDYFANEISDERLFFITVNNLPRQSEVMDYKAQCVIHDMFVNAAILRTEKMTPDQQVQAAQRLFEQEFLGEVDTGIVLQEIFPNTEMNAHLFMTVARSYSYWRSFLDAGNEDAWDRYQRLLERCRPQFQAMSPAQHEALLSRFFNTQIETNSPMSNEDMKRVLQHLLSPTSFGLTL